VYGEIELGDLVEDKTYPGSQGMVTGEGYDFVMGIGDERVCHVHWIYHKGNNGTLTSWKMWKSELKILAKAKKNV